MSIRPAVPHARRWFLALTLLALVPAAGFAAPEAVPGCRVVEAWPGVAFSSPTWVGDAGDGTDFMYVAEQAGKIFRIQKYRGQGPVPQPTLFLDLTAKATAKGQAGIASLAFHPGFRQNGRCFVVYTAPAGPQFKILLAEFSAPGGVCNPNSERIVLEIPKSRPLHNGGGLLFGPDGKLWMGTGDNAAEAEVMQTSQNPASLLGKILRIDVDAPAGAQAYGIPADNPWAAAGAGVRPEIWGYGFRNAWRFCFDAQGGVMVASPGNKEREWVTKVVRGGNHGWPFYEGTRPNLAVPPNLQGQQFVMPAFEYAKEPGETGTTAIVGGFFYRGDRVKVLKGQYLCADYGRGDIYAVPFQGDRGSAPRLVGKVTNPSTLGQDAQGEVYVAAFEEGKIYTVAAQ